MAFREYVVRTKDELAKVHKNATLVGTQGAPWGFGPAYWDEHAKETRFAEMAAALPLTVVFEPEEA